MNRILSDRFKLAMIAIVAVVSIAACTNTSPSLNKYFAGTTLFLNITAIERTPELLYSTIDPEDVIRDWRLVPSRNDLELVMLRMKVENHTAVSAIVDIGQDAAELRDFFNDSYFSLDLNSRLHQDRRNQPAVTVRLSQGQCFDPAQMYITQGTTVSWVNEGETEHFVSLGPEGGNPATITPGGSFSHTFTDLGTVEYQCRVEGIDDRPAQIVVEPSQEAGDDEPGPRRFITGSCEDQRNVGMRFISGSFDLKRGMCIEGWVVFEAPKDTKFRTLRWRAGDTIFIDF